MKLYYDTLVPYMPDSVKNESGELVKDSQKAAGRQAMMELAKFQNLQDRHVINVAPLYQAVIYASIYANIDLVDTIIRTQEAPDPADGVAVTHIIDDAAISLFKSIRAGVKPEDTFDAISFTANILAAAHAITAAQEAKSENLRTEALEESKVSEENT